MNQYITEINRIVDKYKSIGISMRSLEEQLKLLALRKQEIELDLAKTREEERSLIDKIKNETGRDPDFYKILQEVNHENDTMA